MTDSSCLISWFPDREQRQLRRAAAGRFRDGDEKFTVHSRVNRLLRLDERAGEDDRAGGDAGRRAALRLQADRKDQVRRRCTGRSRVKLDLLDHAERLRLARRAPPPRARSSCRPAPLRRRGGSNACSATVSTVSTKAGAPPSGVSMATNSVGGAPRRDRGRRTRRTMTAAAAPATMVTMRQRRTDAAERDDVVAGCAGAMRPPRRCGARMRIEVYRRAGVDGGAAVGKRLQARLPRPRRRRGRPGRRQDALRPRDARRRRACPARIRPPGRPARRGQSPPRHSFKTMRLRLRTVFTVATGRAKRPASSSRLQP